MKRLPFTPAELALYVIALCFALYLGWQFGAAFVQ